MQRTSRFVTYRACVNVNCSGLPLYLRETTRRPLRKPLVARCWCGQPTRWATNCQARRQRADLSNTCAAVASASERVSRTSIGRYGQCALTDQTPKWRSAFGRPRSSPATRVATARPCSACACWSARRNPTCRLSQRFPGWCGKLLTRAACNKEVSRLLHRLGTSHLRRTPMIWSMRSPIRRGWFPTSCARSPKAKRARAWMRHCCPRSLWVPQGSW